MAAEVFQWSRRRSDGLPLFGLTLCHPPVSEPLSSQGPLVVNLELLWRRKLLFFRYLEGSSTVEDLEKGDLYDGSAQLVNSLLELDCTYTERPHV
jgi:hypothetical protein